MSGFLHEAWESAGYNANPLWRFFPFAPLGKASGDIKNWGISKLWCTLRGDYN